MTISGQKKHSVPFFSTLQEIQLPTSVTNCCDLQKNSEREGEGGEWGGGGGEKKR